MKKMLLGMCASLALGCSLIVGLNANSTFTEALAEEPVVSENVEETVWEEKVLTFTDEVNKESVKITLTSPTECEFSVITEAETLTRTLTYELVENKLTVHLDETHFVAFTVNTDNTLVYIEDNLVETFECTVKIQEGVIGGQVTVENTQGHVGDIVTINIDPDVFYMLTGLTVNGNTIVANEEGKYSFVLVEGENLIVPTFAVNEALLKEFSGIYADIKAGNWTEVFSVENVLLILNWILDGAIGIALIKILSKYKKLKALGGADLEKAVTDVVNNVKEVVPETVTKLVTDFLDKLITPLLAKMTNIEEAMKVFSRCLALAQENTPEARLAIVDELSKLKVSETDLIETVKKFIKDEMELVNKQYQEQVNALEEAQKANQKMLEENSKPNEEKAEEIENIRPLE